MNNPEYIVIHTAAFQGDISESTLDEWHMARGWRESGYHRFVNYDGTIERGRDDDEVGAHCKDMGLNSRSIGICFEGHGDVEKWTPEQIQAFRELATHYMKKYDIPAAKIIGHREAGAPKTCPGKLVDMDAVRAFARLALKIEEAQADVERMEPKPPVIL